MLIANFKICKDKMLLFLEAAYILFLFYHTKVAFYYSKLLNIGVGVGRMDFWGSHTLKKFLEVKSFNYPLW